MYCIHVRHSSDTGVNIVELMIYIDCIFFTYIYLLLSTFIYF